MKAEIFNRKLWLPLKPNEEITDLYGGLLTQSGFTVLGFIDYIFDNNGYTAMWLLAESHLAVHTFPEEGKMYVELSSCNEKKTKKFIELLNK